MPIITTTTWEFFYRDWERTVYHSETFRRILQWLAVFTGSSYNQTQSLRINGSYLSYNQLENAQMCAKSRRDHLCDRVLVFICHPNATNGHRRAAQHSSTSAVQRPLWLLQPRVVLLSFRSIQRAIWSIICRTKPELAERKRASESEWQGEMSML